MLARRNSIVVDELSGTSADDPVERVQRVVELALLEVDAREPKRGVVAHCFVDGALEHGLDRAAGAMMHAIVQLEVADRELGLAQVAVQRIELRLVEAVMLAELGIEPLERFEVVPLMRVVQRLAEIQSREVGCSAAAAAACAAAARPSRRDDPAIERAWDTSCDAAASLPLTTHRVDARGRQRDAEQFRLDALVERERLGLAEILAARALAVDRHLDLVRAGRNVAGVDPLHAAVLQRFELLEAVDVVRRELAVDVDLHGVEAKRVAFRDRDENREMRVRRIQQLLFEAAQLRRDAEHVGFDLLHLLVEAAHLGSARGLFGRRDPHAHTEHKNPTEQSDVRRPRHPQHPSLCLDDAPQVSVNTVWPNVN